MWAGLKGDCSVYEHLHIDKHTPIHATMKDKLLLLILLAWLQTEDFPLLTLAPSPPIPQLL